ncbi:MAG: hypothetical protein ABSB12_02690 [Candidatus Saccharimonadales bacterium]|jgi:hypothetical protein
MENFPYSDDPLHHDPVYARAMEILDKGLSHGHVLYEAAKEISLQETILRQMVLRDNQTIGSVLVLDCELFPPDVFNPDGSRKTDQDGSPRLTTAEARTAYELAESQNYQNS